MMTIFLNEFIPMHSPMEVNFRYLFESAPGLYLVLLPDLTIVAVSNTYLQATMTQKDAILGRGLFDVFPDNPDDPSATGVLNLRASLDYVLQHGKPHTMAVQKYDIRRPDGSFEERFWSPLNTPVFNDKKEIAWIIHQVEDVTEIERLKKDEIKKTKKIQETNKKLLTEITEREKAEKQTKESEEQLQTIFNAAPDAVIVIDEEGIILKWNPKAETLFGWKAEEVSGKMLSETIIPPRYREAHRAGMKHFLKTGEGPVLEKAIEIHARNKNNVEFDVALSISRTVVNGKYLFIGFIRDITDRKHAEEQIQKQKQDIQDFIDSMSTLCAKLTTDGKMLIVNKTALQATGLSMEDLLKINFIDGQWWTFDPEVHSRVRDAFKKSCSGVAINYYENIFVFGQILTINFSLIPILKPDGSVDYIVAEGRDITAQKRAEEKIRQMNAELEKRIEEKTSETIQSEKKFRNLIENSTDIISLTDENFKTIYRSPSAERITGWTNEEREKLGIVKLFHPDDFARMKIAMKELLKNPHKQLHLTYRHRHKDGHYIWLDGVITNMLHDETIKAILFNLRDVTENKKAQDLLQASENRFRSIIEQFPYPVVTYTPDGDYTTANQAWEIMWQDKRENVKEYNIRKDPLMIASGLSKYVERAFSGEVAISEPYLYDPVLIGQAGRKRWMQMTLYPLKNADGEILEVILILQDVTPNKEAEEEIKTLNELLEKKVIERTVQFEAVNKELEAFSYSVSHDLRAPLRIIDGYTEMLVSDYQNRLDEEGKRMFGIITANVRKMGQLIDDLLNLSQTGRKELIVQTTDMNKLVKSVIDGQFPLNVEKPLNIKMEKLEPAECDSGLLRQVWANLISNAIKYSRKQEHPEIRINSFRQDGEIIYEINDNGVGFDMKYAAQLFGVFQRLHKVTEFEGTGVGLALVKRIVTKHGGKVWAKAGVSKGATFFFSLPAGRKELSV